jgi:hypothetical protein
MASQIASRLKWIVLAIGILAVWLIARWTVLDRQQVESDISGRQYQKPQEESQDIGLSREPQFSSLADVLDLAKQLKQNMESQVEDYTAKVVKRERIKGKLGDEVFMLVKIRHAQKAAVPPVPFSVYLTYVAPSASEGREVLWVEGRNKGKLLTYQFGLRLNLPTDGLLAMMGNKYPITDIGMLNLAEKLIEKGERDLDQPGCKVEIFENQSVDDYQCKLIQVTHPQPLPGLDYHLAQIFIDNQTQLPIRYAAYLWPEKEGEPPLLEEEYTYLNLQVNTGLTDTDFDPSNPDYNFPK